MRILTLTALTCASFAGCLDGFQGSWDDFQGERLGPGHCMKKGGIEIEVQSFEGPPNATLVVNIHNLRNEPLWVLNGVRVMGTGPLGKADSSGYSHNHQIFYGTWVSPHVKDGVLGPQGNGTLVYRMTDLPDSPWKELSFDYGGEATLHCSLVGDNAPWAFANSTAHG